ncbi:MAG TPA: amino acid adenylation domain-containing protein, partial [Pyrinomonadaceae bacterium]|nr:amino acid adenylation domain-containing protein [Pyrinomonadaceae bacterium]
MKNLIGLITGENSNLLVGLLGILKAGCGFVPIEPTYPLERINYIVGDCGIEVVITESRYLDLAWRISETHPTLRHVICLDDHTAKKPEHVEAEFHEHRDWSRRQSTNEELNGDPDKVAYVIYTSGSTGRPKGVPITHRNLVPLLLWSRDYFNLGEHTKVLQNLSYCFDFGVFELLTTLIFGGTLYFPGKDRSDKLLTSAAFVNEHGINTIHTTPSYFREITSSGVKFESLEILHLGGEQLTKSTVDYVFEAVGEQCELYNGYGPTEASVNCSIMRVSRNAELHRSAPIGRVTANNELYVLDRKGQPVPIGVAGELHVGGPGLADGYLNRSRLTAEKFIPHAFGNEPGARLYKTGDLVRYRPDGNIEFLGRLDDQVKVRGYRIELGEIEAALVQHPSVQETVVMPHDGVTGTRRLVAYVIDKDGQSTTTSELRAFLKKRLPEYMVPSSFVKLESLPLTSSGKVERKALPAPDQSRPDLAETFVAPRSSDEEIIAGICGEVLAIDQVGAHDNLFDLGCHSILATKIVARLREALGVDLALTSIFEAPTVAELALVCRDLNVAGTNLQLPPIQPVARNNGHLPLSFEQERIWFLDQLTENNISYYVPRALRIKGDFSVEVLERTFTELVRRHEILRTGFRDVDGRPVQIITPPQPFKVNVIDLKNLNGEKESEAQRLVLAEGQKLFDLDQPPLVRVTLLQLEKDDHVLAVTEHHLVHDGWTQGVLLAEFLTLYPALAAGKPSPLPELPFQYADFAAWERKCWQGEFVEAQLSYWKKQLAGAPALLDVPTDRPRPPVQSFRGAEQQLEISSQLAESLRAFSRRESVTLFMTMLAVFKVLLSRYSGQLDMVVGTAIANRRCVEIEGMLGMIVNTVVLRTDLSGDLTFREALKRVRKVCLEAYAHQDMPFEKLVEALQPQRTLSHMPIFQAMFGFLDTPMRTLELPGMKLELIESHNHSAKFDLNVVFVLPAEQRIGLNLGEAESEITGLFEYNTDIFDDETIRRMLGHYHTLLESVVKNPEVRISELQLLTESERQQLLNEWNETETGYARELCMHQLVEGHAERTPHAVALVDREVELSYAEVNRRANQLAHYLRKHGVGPETLVAVVLERSARMIVSLLAILKAGGAYLPLDPNNPKEHIGYMLADAGVRVVLTGQGAKEHLAESGAEVIDLDAQRDEIAQESDANPVNVTTATNLAYVIYTSGSTGRPKGVELQHRGLVNLVTWHQRVYEVDGATRATQVARQTFDASVWEIWSCLGNGGSLYLIDEETILSPAQLWEWLATHEITHCFLPTPLAEAVLPHVSSEAGALKYLLIGGDKLHQGAATKLPFTLVNLYGPTENTVVSTSAEVRAASETGRAPSIGRPIANSDAYVLDEHGAPVPVGVAGELYVGGEGLARGYLKRAALTAERFVPHPYSREKGARLYRTGDVVRWLASGELEFLGRQDEQVKVRGYRIELGEIEALLATHPEVSEAAVLVNGEGELRRLVAYVVAKDEAAELTMTAMRNYLQEKLPDYMIPTALVQLSELPMTPNGKVDRRALPEPELDRGSLGTEYAAPVTAVEEILVNIWSEVLGMEQVGTHDNFFDLGGHSLLATQVISRVRQAFSIELPLRALFEAPTVVALAMQVEAVRQMDQEVLAPSLRAVKRDGDLPLSFAQQRLWFIDQLEPGQSTYNIPAAVRLTGELDVVALERALSEVVRRHEALRTTFPTVDGLPVQRIAEASSLQLPLVDLSGMVAPETEVERIASEEAQLPFDLSVGPLLRAQLLRVSAEEHVVLVTVHHIVSDGWSMSLLVREVSRLYEAYRSGQESPLAELPIQYADYATWQREWLSGEVLEKELSYWREQLAGAPPVLELPADHVRPPVQTFRGARQSFVIDASVAEGVKALSRREGATLFMTLLAAFETLLYRYSGQTSVVVGTPIAGRTQVEVEELIGFFVNTLVLRTEVSGGLSFVELLRQVKEVALGAYAHQEVPFEKLVEELEPERSLSHTPLFQVMFVMQNEDPVGVSMSGLELSGVQTERVTAKFDLTLQLT